MSRAGRAAPSAGQLGPVHQGRGPMGTRPAGPASWGRTGVGGRGLSRIYRGDIFFMYVVYNYKAIYAFYERRTELLTNINQPWFQDAFQMKLSNIIIIC